MALPIVSVIIPTYNRFDFICDAIDSALSQTYKEIEIIIIDDGSTDGTQELLSNKYGGKIKYYWQANQGRSVARNLGISLATGKYLAFLDSDDKWNPKKLELLVPKLENLKKSGKKTALICATVWLINEEGKIIRNKPAGRIPNINKYELKDFFIRPRIYSPPSNAVFVSELIKEIGGFDDDIQYGEDMDLLIRLKQKYNFAFINKPLTYYRIFQNGQQRFPLVNQIELHLSDYIRVIDKNSHMLNDEKFLQITRAKLFEKAAYWYFIYENWDKGFAKLMLGSRLDFHCLDDEQRIIYNISDWGIESSILNAGPLLENMTDYFNEVYIKNIRHRWPNNLLLQENITKKIWARFCHTLACDNRVTKNKKQNRYLCRQAILNNQRFLLSKTTLRKCMWGS